MCICWNTAEGKYSDGIQRNASWEFGRTEQIGTSGGSDLAGTGTSGAGRDQERGSQRFVIVGQQRAAASSGSGLAADSRFVAFGFAKVATPGQQPGGSAGTGTRDRDGT